MLVTGAAPATGAVTPAMAAVLMVVAFAVAGKTALTVPELAALVTDVAPATVKKFAAPPVRV